MKKLVLKTPVQMGEGGELLKELTFRKPKGKDLFDLPEKPTMKDLARLASKLSNTEMVWIGELEADDYISVMEIIGDFFGSGPEIGNKE